MSDQCIPPNPDVSGIGVRYAIYIQNILCFLPVIMNLVDDGKISADELKGIQDQSVGMLAIAFSILITTIILAQGAGGNQGITNYHASIVLDLSWMNNTSTWIWFILYVHRRSKPKGGPPVPATWKAWYNLLRGRGVESEKEGRTGTSIEHHLVHRVFRIIQQVTPSISLPSFKSIFRIMQDAWYNISLRIMQYGWWFLRPPTIISRRIWSAATRYPVLTLGSFHLSLMAAIGMWLWSNPSNFGQYIDCNPTIQVIVMPTSLLSRPLKVASLTFYSLFLAPVFNLCLPFLFFLALHISYNWLRKEWEKAKIPGTQDKEAAQDVKINDSFSQSGVSVADNNHGKSSDAQPHTAFLVVGLLCLLAVNILFIIDIELTLRRNQANQTGGDDDWGFGQVLSLLLLIVPLRDAWKALQEIDEKLRDSKKQQQKQLEDFFRAACEATPAHEELERLLGQDGVTSKTQIVGNGEASFNSFLSMAAYYGKADLVKCLRQGREKERGKIAISNHLQHTHYI
jgi:hypothetical protein